MNAFIDYILRDPSILHNRENMIDMFAFVPDRPVYPEKSVLKNGIVFAEEPKSATDIKYGYYGGDKFIKLPTSQKPQCPFSPYDMLMVSKKHIANAPSTPIKSSVGHFILNMVALGNFGSKFPYINEPLRKMKGIEADLCEAILDEQIHVSDYKEYINTTSRLLNLGDLFVPTMSPATTSIDPKIIKRRDELLKQYKDQLDDPKISSMIEQELIGMYKESVKNDPSYRFFNSNPGKSFESSIKRMFIMVGGVSDFGSANMVTIGTSLQEGLKPENMVISSNDARKGAAARGVDTQVSGYYTKLLAKALQDIALTMDDCGDVRGTELTFNDFQTPERFVGRYHMVGGKTVEITKKDLNKYRGKTIKLRSPQTCKCKDGFCFTCMGKIFKQLDIVAPGILGVDISSTNMQRCMSLMHAETTVVQRFKLEDFLI